MPGRKLGSKHERYPEPVQQETMQANTTDAYEWDPINFEGVEPETAGVINEVLDAFNTKFGTDVKPALSGIPFENEQ